MEKNVTYEKDGVTMEGFIAYDEALIGKRPAVLVIHQWMGLTENEKRRSRMLAEMGCNVFAADARSWEAMRVFFEEIFRK